MANVTFRLELNTAATKTLISALVESLASTTPGQRDFRTGLNVVLSEDDTRTGQRNGHRLALFADAQSAGVYATAYDLVINGE